MTPFYIVKVCLFRDKQLSNNPFQTKIECKLNSLQETRMRAFEIFQNYIDVLYDGIEQHQYSTSNMSFDLHKYVRKKQEYTTIEKALDLDVDFNFDKGVSIYLVLNGETHITLEGEKIYTNKILIHRFDDGRVDISNYIQQGLLEENLIYKKIRLQKKR